MTDPTACCCDCRRGNKLAVGIIGLLVFEIVLILIIIVHYFAHYPQRLQ